MEIKKRTMERGSEGEAVRARVGGKLNRKWSNQRYKKRRETKKERIKRRRGEYLNHIEEEIRETEETTQDNRHTSINNIILALRSKSWKGFLRGMKKE